jgi:hypothetical protein
VPSTDIPKRARPDGSQAKTPVNHSEVIIYPNGLSEELGGSKNVVSAFRVQPYMPTSIVSMEVTLN